MLRDRFPGHPVHALALILFLISSALPTISPASDAGQHFQDGVAAFRAENFSLASQHFRQARAAGLDTPALHYNLGVSAFRNADYLESAQAFRVLTGYPDWQALAYYNLGLVAERQNRLVAARRHYQRAIDSATDEKVERLAAHALANISSDALRISAVASVSGGYDSNPRMIDTTDTFTGNAEVFLEGFLSIDMPVSDTPFSILAETYLRHYPGDTSLNDRIIQLGISREAGLLGFKTDTDFSLGFFTIGGEHYQTRYRARSIARTGLGEGILTLAFEGSHLTAGTGYEFLEGTQARLQTGWQQGFEQYYYRLDYRLEINDRTSRDAAGNRVSVSPTRNRIRAILGHQRQAQQWLEAGLGYESSVYKHDEDNTGDKRRDNALQFLLRAGNSLSPNTQLILEYIYTDNNSNIPAFDTDQHLIQLLIEYRNF